MTHEDRPASRLLSRREVVTFLGATGVAWLLTAGLSPRRVDAETVSPTCVVRPEQMEGPYFVDERLHRSDIRSDPSNGRVSPGTPLALTILVSRFNAGGCQPLPSAQVDIWHCDALGVYSDVQDPGFDSTGQKFLRGYQVTDARGSAQFVTIYPGWYPGRTVHIHFKIRTAPLARRTFEFTSQLYFRRWADGSRPCCPTLYPDRATHDEKPTGLDLPAWRRPTSFGSGYNSRRLLSHIRNRSAASLNGMHHKTPANIQLREQPTPTFSFCRDMGVGSDTTEMDCRR